MDKNKTKICSRCKVKKDVTDFHKNPCKGDGLTAYCKTCNSMVQKIRKSLNPELYRAIARKSYHKHKEEHRAKWAAKVKTIEGKFTRYKTDSKVRNLVFPLTFDIFKSIITQPCFYCGHQSLEGIGIDRLDSKQGYLENNIVPCCYMCNIMKHKFSLESFLKQIALIHKYRSL